MEIRRAEPHPSLRSLVRSFEERRINVREALSWPVAARPHLILDIHLATPYSVSVDDDPGRDVPRVQVVGPRSQGCARVHLWGEIHVFNISFQPTGLNRLIGIGMTALVDQDPAAADVFGRACVQSLTDGLHAAADFQARVGAAERWLGRLMVHSRADGAIDRAARRLLVSHEPLRIDAIAGQCMIGARQFQRRFLEAVGLAPKVFARTIRFDRALRARHEHPDRSWTEIAHGAGYFDQAHFVRECRAFVGHSPRRLAGELEHAFFPPDV